MKALIWKNQIMEVMSDIPLPYEVLLIDCPEECRKDWQYIEGQFVPATKKTQIPAIRQLNLAFQISPFHDALVNYCIDISCNISLSSGQLGVAYLEIASDVGFTQNVQELGRIANGNSGSLSIGLNLTINTTATLSGYVPSGYYSRIRTSNNLGIPIFIYRSGQEILF